MEKGYLSSGSTDNYFRGAWEKSHTFGDLGSTAKKLWKKHSVIWGDQSTILREHRPQYRGGLINTLDREDLHRSS